LRTIITGASKGIGRQITIALAPDCQELFLVGKTRQLLDELQEELKGLAPDCRVNVIQANLASADDITSMMSKVSERTETLDVLVNCAGKAIPPTGVREISLEEWNEIFQVNVTAPFLLTQAVVPLMRASKRAVIVNVASTAAISARPGWSAYAASKAALVNFSNTMAEELQPEGISVHCVAPGRTATDLRKLLSPGEDPSSIMQPEAVAAVVNFLVSPAGEVLRGQTISVRGN
jgi:NAD(P)-dependent dehydrogenase (short-subunit alcohol dehydrogenase family)